jgi:hypothetical protein
MSLLTTKVTFTIAPDWIRWSKEFRLRAVALDIWKYIDPEAVSPWPTQPIAPELHSYTRRNARATIRVAPVRPSGSNARPSTRRVSSRTTSPETEADANQSLLMSISDLTPEGKADYQYDWSTYIHRSKEYKEHKTAVKELVTWTLSTISPTLREICCHEQTTLTAWYKALRQTGSAYEENLISDARTKYQQAIKPLTKVPRSFDTWVSDWEVAIAEGSNLGLEDTKQARFWGPDLAKALKQILPIWATNFMSNNKKEVRANQLSYREVAADLRLQWEVLQQTKSSSVAKGAFLTYGEQAQEQDNELEPKPTPGAKKTRHTAKRKRAGTESAGTESEASSRKACRACLGPHNLSECYYAFNRKAPDGWRPNQGIKRLVQDRIKQDNSLAEEIKRLRKGKAIATNANSDSENNS